MIKILLTLLFSINTFGYVINVNSIKVEPTFEIRFNLYSDQSTDASAVLDCQSFFKKIDFFDKKGLLVSENYITMGECEYLYEQTMSCLDKSLNKCLDSDYIFSDTCSCD